MNYTELLKRYNLLLSENSRLIEEINLLKAQLGITKSEPSNNITKIIPKNSHDDESTDITTVLDVNNKSDSISKIKLFMSLFRGRDDVYARRWENKKKATSGYSPVCLNQCQPGLCGKPKVPCIKCVNKRYDTLNEHAIENHLRGTLVAGIYPMLPDETCYSF